MPEIKVKMTDDFYRKLQDTLATRKMIDAGMGLPEAFTMIILHDIKANKEVAEFPPK